MQGYGRIFARIYNLKWTDFAKRVAPKILEFYAETAVEQDHNTVLDVCCGTGQLAVYFLEHGYRVTGLDLSEHMLECARENAAQYLASGQAKFVQADATDFTLDERFGLVISTYDALNHLPDEEALKRCFECVYAVNDGCFIFDLNTKIGLTRWSGMMVSESEDLFLMNRGIYDNGMDRAWTKITGFLRMPDGLYERFDETAFNTVFDMRRIKAALLETGWADVYYARLEDLKTPIDEPEEEQRVFFVAKK